MDEMFLQELNAITNYANNSNTKFTEETVIKMLMNLLNMSNYELYGNRCCPFANEPEKENNND
jgi:hypothetical protein